MAAASGAGRDRPGWGPAGLATVGALFLCLWTSSPARGALPVIPPTGSTPPGAGSPPPPTSWQEIAVELRAGQMARRTVLAYEDEGTVLVPVSAVLDLVEVSSTIGRDRMLRARIEPRGVDLGLSWERSIAWSGRDTLQVEHGRLSWQEDDLFAPARLVAALLGTGAFVDLGELTVTFDPVDDLPLGRRWRRERVRLANGAGRRGREPEVSLALERPAWKGAVLDWAVSLPEAQDLSRSSTSLAFGGSLFGGGLDLEYREVLDDPSRRQLELAWTGVWPDSRRFRQLRLGRTHSTAPRARAMRGVALSNSPFIRSRDFDQREFRGYLEPGWEVEVYEGGELVAFRRADERGYYEFELPVGYGQNALEIRGYGPNGESRIIERALRVDFDRLPGGVTEYGVSAGECVDDDCDGLLNIDLRHGLHRDWTARVGTESFLRREGETLYHPYAAVAGNLAQSWQLRLETAWRARHAVHLGFEPTVNLRATAGYERYDPTVADPVLTSPGERSRSELRLFWRPVTRWRSFFFRGDLLRRDGDAGPRWRSTLGVNHVLGRVRVSSDWIEEWTEAMPAPRSTRWSVFGTSVLQARWFRPLHGLYVRAGTELDVGPGERDRVSLRLGRRVARSARIEVGAEWYRNESDPLLTLTVTSTGDHAHASAYVSRSVYGDYSNLVQAEGSLLYNGGAGRIESRALRSLGRGGIQGVVFVDANANGVFDADEQAVPGARLVVGGDLVETDGYGRYGVWHLPPYERAHIELETASLSDPMLMPDFEVAAAAVLPNGFRKLDVPLVPGVELTGRVVLEEDGSRRALGGVPLRVLAVERDRRHDVRTFSDGEFYVLPVAPGRYRIRIDTGYLERTGLRWGTGPEEILVPAAAEAETFDVEIVLRPARSR